MDFTAYAVTISTLEQLVYRLGILEGNRVFDSAAIKLRITDMKEDMEKWVVNQCRHADVVIKDKGLTEEEIKLVRSNQKIAAIKAVRQRTGFDLKSSKDMVENFQNRVDNTSGF